MPEQKILIIGDGFAGCLLAWQLARQGARVRLLGAGEPGAWSVAAGLAAPVTGQRATLQPDAAGLLAQATALYRSLESELGLSLWRPLRLLHIEREPEGAQRWAKRCAEPAFQPYLRQASAAEMAALPGLRQGLHGTWIAPAFRLDLQSLVQALRARLDAEGVRVQAQVDLGQLRLRDDGGDVQGESGRWVVLAQGAQGRSEPLNAPAKLAPTRGELLELSLPGWPQDLGLHGDPFVLPTGGETVLCGATYDRVNLDAGATREGRAALLNGLQGLLSLPYSVSGQRAGLRPTSVGHQAFAARHPQAASLFILNGLGSKAALWAPSLTASLARQLAL